MHTTAASADRVGGSFRLCIVKYLLRLVLLLALLILLGGESSNKLAVVVCWVAAS